ncbi:MAG: hypothetical protein C0490_02760 [Marivirga sp.]|nr:hypothetical protein [Marivirga sp.]
MLNSQTSEFIPQTIGTWLKEGVSKILISSILVLFAGTAAAQEGEENEIPRNVVEAFETLYPKIKTVSWIFNELNYEVSFKLDGKAVSLVFDESGYVSQVKNEIKQFELPMDIGQLLTKEYSGWRLGKTSHIDSFGSAYYETVVQREKETVILVFHQDGGLMMKLIQ